MATVRKRLSDEDVERIAKRVAELIKPAPITIQPNFGPTYWPPNQTLPNLMPYVTC